MLNKKSKGQTSLEILIVMGGLIIIAVVVVTIILASSKSKVSAITTADKANSDIIDKTLFPPNINSVQCSLDDTNTNVNFNISVISSVTKDISEYCLILNGTTTGLCSSAGNTELSFSSSNLGTGNYRVNLVSKNSNNAISNNSVGFSCDLDLPTTTIPIVIIPPIGETLDFNCPDGYAKVSGNPDYETGNLINYPKGGFCVMKWEAKMDFNNDGVGDLNTSCMPSMFSTPDMFYSVWSMLNCSVPTTTKVVSTSQGMPIGNLTQSTAKSFCSNLGEDNYHLITNDEWMTIARDVEQQSNNWPAGGVGIGSLKLGNTLVAVSGISYSINSATTGLGPIFNGATQYNSYRLLIDFNGNPHPSSAYCKTGCSGNTSQFPKLILSTGEEIWDFSGNMMEYVDKTLYASNLPRTDPSFRNQWVEFNQITSNGTLQDKDFKPSNSMWSSAQGTGKIATNWTQTGNTVFIRGGGTYYYSISYDSSAIGIYSLYLIRLESTALTTPYPDYGSGIGFRCVYTPS